MNLINYHDMDYGYDKAFISYFLGSAK